MEVDQQPLALIIHGWNDDPTLGWMGWLTKRLERVGYQVVAPHLLTEARPLLETWTQQLLPYASQLDDRSIIISHSLGTFLTLRLLESLPKDVCTRAVFFVSGFYDAPDARASHWFEPEPDWSVIREKTQESVCIYSDDDRIVTPDRTRRLAHKLGAELVCFPGNGHFLGSRGMDQFPELLHLLEDKGLYKTASAA